MKFWAEEILSGLTERAAQPSLPYPLFQMNQSLWGTKPGDLVILAARTSQGKSSFASQWSTHAAQAGHTTCVISLEGRRESWWARMVTQRIKIPFRKVLDPSSHTEFEREQIRVFDQQLRTIPLHVFDGRDL